MGCERFWTRWKWCKIRKWKMLPFASLSWPYSKNIKPRLASVVVRKMAAEYILILINLDSILGKFSDLFKIINIRNLFTTYVYKLRDGSCQIAVHKYDVCLRTAFYSLYSYFSLGVIRLYLVMVVWRLFGPSTLILLL